MVYFLQFVLNYTSCLVLARPGYVTLISNFELLNSDWQLRTGNSTTVYCRASSEDSADSYSRSSQEPVSTYTLSVVDR